MKEFNGETSVADYLTRSKLTFEGRNGVAFAEKFWDYLAAEKPTSIFWTFLPDEVYYDQDKLAKFSRISILTLNVWHFFVRKGCIK